MAAREWERFAIQAPRRGTPPREVGGARLSTVYHVAHLGHARRILEDGALNARLVKDKSRLRKSRTCVTWMSANTWINGPIYGHVQLEFPWSRIVKDRDVYWVETIPYNPAAYRFLISDVDHDASPHVSRYRPKIDAGPLRAAGRRWYWNDKYTSEFMVENDVDLKLCTGLSFVHHNQQFCRPYRSKCPDRTLSETEVAGRFIAFVLAGDLHGLDHVFETDPFLDDRPLHNAVDMGARGIQDALECSEFGGPLARAHSARSVLRGALALLGQGQLKEARRLARLIRSRSAFRDALEEIVNNHFGISAWEAPAPRRGRPVSR
jgi:hypothetical protein